MFRDAGLALLALAIVAVGTFWLAGKSDDTRCSDLSGPCTSRYHLGRAIFLALAVADVFGVVVFAVLARRDARRSRVAATAVLVLSGLIAFVIALWVFSATDMTD